MEFIRSSSQSKSGNSERVESKEDSEIFGEFGGTGKYCKEEWCGMFSLEL